MLMEHKDLQALQVLKVQQEHKDLKELLVHKVRQEHKDLQVLQVLKVLMETLVVLLLITHLIVQQ